MEEEGLMTGKVPSMKLRGVGAAPSALGAAPTGPPGEPRDPNVKPTFPISLLEYLNNKVLFPDHPGRDDSGNTDKREVLNNELAKIIVAIHSADYKCAAAGGDPDPTSKGVSSSATIKLMDDCVKELKSLTEMPSDRSDENDWGTIKMNIQKNTTLNAAPIGILAEDDKYNYFKNQPLFLRADNVDHESHGLLDTKARDPAERRNDEGKYTLNPIIYGLSNINAIKGSDGPLDEKIKLQFTYGRDNPMVLPETADGAQTTTQTILELQTQLDMIYNLKFV